MGWHDPAPWEPEGGDDDEQWLDADPEAWRGTLHLETEDDEWLLVADDDEPWPEELAGPEYWLFKRDDDGEE